MDNLQFGAIEKTVVSEERDSKMVYNGVKRTIDIICSLLGLICLSPVLLVVAIIIKCDSKGPVIFKQKRVGYKGKEFNIYKFRSMVVNADEILSG